MVYTKVYNFVNKFQPFKRAILDQSNFVESTNFDKIENTRVKFRYSCLYRTSLRQRIQVWP